MSLAAIVRVLGGELHAGGARASIPGPGHRPHDRSVSLLLADSGVLVQSFAGDDWRDVLDDLRARGLVGRDGRLVGAGQAAPPPSVAPRPARERQAAALALWDRGRAVGGSLSERHLALRGVRGDSSELRHHPAVRLVNIHSWVRRSPIKRGSKWVEPPSAERPTEV